MKLVAKSSMIAIAALMLWGLTIYLFTIVAPWTAAIETGSVPAEVRADATNSKWIAAVNDHGVWRHWERGTVSQRPAFFAVHLAALLVCGTVAFRLGFRASRIYKAESGRGDGIAPVTPPTPPGMRVCLAIARPTGSLSAGCLPAVGCTGRFR